MAITSQQLRELSEKLTETAGHKDYHEIQLQWTTDIWKIIQNHLPATMDRCLDIGAFTGINAIALAGLAREVIAVDQKSFLVKWAPRNVKFAKADIDSGSWQLPDGPFDVCFLVEVIEHLKWSPLPLCKWLNKNVRMLIVTTPDDDEWPAMTIHPWTQYTHYRHIPSAFPGCRGNPNPMYHVKQYKQWEFLELLTECNFRVLEMNRVGNGKHQMLAVCVPR